MKTNNREFSLIKQPETLAIQLIVDKNFWLTRIRWVYSLFIFLFFYIYNSLARESRIAVYDLLLIIFLSGIGNLIFIFVLRRNLRRGLNESHYEMFTSIAALQLDFDFVVLALLVFFSGGFESPVIILFIFYIMVSTFLIYYKKAFRNMLAAIVLITLIFFQNTGLNVPTQKLATMIAFNIILVFSFFVSAYLSRNIRDNEKVLQELLKKTQKLSVTDGLTDLYNQTHFFEMLKFHLDKAKSFGLTFSVIIFDVDHFKSYNDHNGHIQGSEALAKVGSLMKKVFRASDILAKYGGDEFVAILPSTDKVGAFLAADRLRETIATESFPGEAQQPMGTITISVGVATFPDHGSTDEEILEKADRAMYMAKVAGRNRTVIYSEKLGETED